MDCHEYGGYTRTVGMPYGVVKRKGKQYLAHRWFYCEYHGIPITAIKGKVILHSCDNPKCINPNHLILGTQKDNMFDMRAKGRSDSGVSRYNAKLTPDKVLYAKRVYTPRHSEYGLTPLAKQFGVVPSVLHNAIHGKRWASLQDI